MLGCIGALICIGPLVAQPLGWQHGIALRVIPATSVADLQVRLELNSDTFDYGKAKADGSDLRVYAGSTELAYWIESWNPAGVSTLWVKVPTVGTRALTLYFGNPAATAVSSGAATFELFDDFESLDAWTLRTQATGTAVQTTFDGHSVAQLTSPDMGNGSVLTRPFAASGATGHVIETRALRPAGSGVDGILVGFTDGSLYATYSDLPDNGYVGYLFRHGNIRSGLLRMVAGGGGDWNVVDSNVADQWYVGSLRWIGDTLTSERDRRTLVSAPAQAFATLSHLHISTLASVWNFDWVLVRKAAASDSVATPVTPLLYAANHSAHTVTVHERRDAGDQPPLKTYGDGGAGNGILTPTCAFVAGDELFVTNHQANTITVHDVDAPGDAPPKRSIRGNLHNPAHCWVDHGELYVANANGGNVQVYDSSDHGEDVVPKRVLNVQARGLAVHGDELILPLDPYVTAGDSIHIYPKSASSPASPSRIISGSNTQLAGLIGVHASDGELFVVTSGAVRVFNIGDDGNVAPKRSITGAQTGFAFPTAVWVIGEELFVADANSNRISVFNRNDSGDVAPKRVITGAATGLNYPYHLTFAVSTLSITRTGSGGGTVSSSDAQIACGATCAHPYANGSTVTISATADAGSVFTGWLGACTGRADCKLTINAATAVTATFAPEPLAQYTANVDANAGYEAAHDGLLAMRYLFGVRGLALTDHALGPLAARTDPDTLAGYLDDMRPLLDFDGDGSVAATTDGLLLMRYLLGLRGDALIAGALGSAATRTTAAAIEQAIGAVVP